MKNKKMQSRGNEVLDTYKIDITPDKSLYLFLWISVLCLRDNESIDHPTNEIPNSDY